MTLKPILFLLVGLLGSVTVAHATIIDFTAPDTDLTLATYAEDGFVVDGTATSSGRIENNELTESLFASPEVFSIMRAGGGLFQFVSVDIRSAFSYPTDGFELIGFNNNVQVADFGAFTTSSASLVTILTGDSTLIDELRLVPTDTFATPGNGPVWDNFVFNEASAPIPGTLALLSLGLLGFRYQNRQAQLHS